MTMITDPTRVEHDMAADRAPTPAPDKCEGCLCTTINRVGSQPDTIYFECGQRYYCWSNKWERDNSEGVVCTRSVAAAVALRAERDAAVAEVAELTMQNHKNDWNTKNHNRAWLALSKRAHELGFISASVKTIDELADIVLNEGEGLRAELATLTARLARVTSIVDAAKAWREVTRTQGGVSHIKHMHDLVVAVDALAEPVDAPSGSGYWGCDCRYDNDAAPVAAGGREKE